VRLYGDPGLDLTALSEIAEVIDREVIAVPDKAPVVGRDIFTTQAGLHQSGVAKHEEAPGGLIYLPYTSSVVGREGDELHRVGGVSGMDGLVAILNKELEARGEEKRFSLVSRTVLALYRIVHEAYDGTWDEEAGQFVGARKAFFEADELLEAALEIERRS